MSHKETQHAPSGAGAAENAAWAFYLIAALGSTIGQIWVGAEVPPWPHDWPIWIRIALVLPFAVVIDLGGVVCSAFADSRQKLGESAYGWRILSAASVCLGVGINILGHANIPYLAVVFGGLGVFAYVVWLLHSAARRRDALRASGKLADTAPAYGLAQWRREPEVTRRAKALALAHGYSMFESLAQARTVLRTEKRHAALATHIEKLIKSRHKDPIRAAIAATTLDIDAIAAELTAQADHAGWARAIGADLRPPAVDPALLAPAATAPSPAVTPPTVPALALPAPAPELDVAALKLPSSAVLRQIPVEQADYDRWRELWQRLRTAPEVSNQDAAKASGVSIRTVQRVREAGVTGWLDSPLPPIARVAALASKNGHVPPLQAAAQ